MMADSDVTVRAAESKDIREIHSILAEAFAPYRKRYTEKAYNVTVVSKKEIENRLNDQNALILVAQLHKDIVGTAAIKMYSDNLYLQSMAVRPGVQRKGIGMLILGEIEKRARETGVDELSLECYEPLTKAIRVYEKFGFRKTGRRRPYYGITIFEMKKNIRRVDD
jgi:ribosomal protein S18 acetylase RimI-like enzyme